jgi:membrane protease YdiL (CAAX protease family)
MSQRMTPNRTSLLQRITTLEPAPPWSLFAAVFTIIAAFTGIVAAVGLVQTWLGERPSTLVSAWTLGNLVMIFLITRTRRAEKDRAALRLEAVRVPLSLLLVLNIGAAMALDLLSLAVTGAFLPAPELLALWQQPEAATWVFGVLLMLVAQPFGEELVFRGVAQPALRAALGAWGGLIVTAVLYGVFHMLAYPPRYAGVTQTTVIWYGLILPILQGMVFSVNRAATGSTRAAIAAHVAFGLFALLKVFLLVR